MQTADTQPRDHRGTVSICGDQMLIPATLMRGGTSRGPFFLADDLPTDTLQRDRILLSALGAGHPLEIDGVGGGHPLTSKAGIVAKSSLAGVDLDFTFAQLRPTDHTVQTTANCGNMLAAVVPFAIDRGLVVPKEDTTTVLVHTVNTGLISAITVSTPLAGGQRIASTTGTTVIDGVPGTGSPITIRFLNTAGSIAGTLLPTGSVRDSFTLPGGERIEVTCLDNGQPMVVIRAEDLKISGAETVAALEANTSLKERVEQIRLAAGQAMGLGDVRSLSYPKMTIISAPQRGGDITTRSLIPHAAHPSIGVLAAVTVATAAALEGSVAADYVRHHPEIYRIEHPSGCFEVSYTLEPDGTERAGIVRTSRLLMRGQIAVPASCYLPVAN